MNMRSTCSKSVFEEIANEEIDTQKELALHARSAKLICSLARSSTRSRAHGKEICSMLNESVVFIQFQPTVYRAVSGIFGLFSNAER